MQDKPRLLITYFSLLSITVVILAACQAAEKNAKNRSPEYRTELQVVRSGYVPDTMWTQAYIAATPGPEPELILTLSQKLGRGIDNYGNLYYYSSEDLGKSWMGPHLLMERQPYQDSLETALSDLYPLLHRTTGKILGTGKMFYYNPRLVEDPEIGRGVGYTVYNPESKIWGPIRTFELPDTDHSGAQIYNPSAGCNQRYDLPNGEILLPVYYLREDRPEGNNITTIVRCRFDGEELQYIEHGDEMTIEQDRGFGETSITAFQGNYFITIRADHSAYVARSTDGIHYTEPVEWRFDDGSLLGSYNTQQHWVNHPAGLFLVYTRRGAGNDHIFRHRAPLFMAQVDPDKMTVVRSSERILIPERGARLGNFGVSSVTEDLTVVSTSERMTEISEAHGADNSVFVVKVQW